MRRVTVLTSLRLECNVHSSCVAVSCLYGVAKMTFVFSHVEYCVMHFVYGFCIGNARVTVEEYQRLFPDRRIPSRGVFTRINQTLRDTGCLPSVAVRSEREVLRTINTRKNILEMVQRVHVYPLVEWPLASAYHVCKCGELYMRKIYILTMIKGYNIWNQATMLSVWICATG